MNKQPRVKIFLAGDVMTGRGVDQILPHPCDPSLHESYVRDARDYVSLAERANGPVPVPVDFDYIWGDALDLWRAHDPDLRIVNLETAVTTSDQYWPRKGINYRMHPRNLPCLTKAGLDCCTLANNHTLDWGREGLEETLETFGATHIAIAGAGRNWEDAARPARLTVSATRNVLVFAVADGSSGVPESWLANSQHSGVNRLNDLSIASADQVAEFIQAHRQPGDIVILSIHWGGNWGFHVPQTQQLFARHIVERGDVDIVHGHSSHHPKAIEFYQGKIIIYGCGDFINDYEGITGHEDYRPWLAAMYFVTIDAVSRNVQQVGIQLLHRQRLRLTKASAEDRRWLVSTLNSNGDPFAHFVSAKDETLVARP